MALFFFVLFLSACSINIGTTDEIVSYNGKNLDIAIVGNKDFPRMSNITFEKISLIELYRTNKQYDGVIITKSEFDEADKESYEEFFQKVEYPVFFYGADDFKVFAFHIEDMTIEDATYKDSAYVQGFQNTEDKNPKYWEFFLDDEELDDQEMLTRMFTKVYSPQG